MDSIVYIYSIDVFLSKPITKNSGSTFSTEIFPFFPHFFLQLKRVQSRLENIDGTEGERGHIAAAVAADKRRKKFQSLKLTWEAAS